MSASDVAVEVTQEQLAWQKATGIPHPHPPTAFTLEYRQAVQGEGPRAYDWKDKPHRLIFDLCREIERLTTSNETARLRESDDLRWFSEQHRLALDHYSPMYGDDDDQSVEWRVTKESGPINDREWEIVGRGETAAEAIAAARTALQSQEPK